MALSAHARARITSYSTSWPFLRTHKGLKFGARPRSYSSAHVKHGPFCAPQGLFATRSRAALPTLHVPRHRPSLLSPASRAYTPPRVCQLDAPFFPPSRGAASSPACLPCFPLQPCSFAAVCAALAQRALMTAARHPRPRAASIGPLHISRRCQSMGKRV